MGGEELCPPCPPPKKLLQCVGEYAESTVNTGRDGSVGIATRYGLDGPGIESRWGTRFSAPVQTGPEAHPVSCIMGTGSFPGVKRPGRGADHPPPSTCRGHERVGLYLYTPSGPHWPVVGRTFTLYLYCFKTLQCSACTLASFVHIVSLGFQAPKPSGHKFLCQFRPVTPRRGIL